MDPHHFGMPHPDSYLIHKPDPHRSEKLEAVVANSEYMEVHPGVKEAHSGAVEAPLESERLTMVPWMLSWSRRGSVRYSSVADSHHFGVGEEPDLDPHQSKKWKIGCGVVSWMWRCYLDVALLFGCGIDKWLGLA
jgi:hypothetical protein